MRKNSIKNTRVNAEVQRCLANLIRGEIKNRTLRSFLYYVPYVTLAVMTFPTILSATQSPIAAAAALVLGIVMAYFGLGLFPVAVSCCVIVFLLELFLCR